MRKLLLFLTLLAFSVPLYGADNSAAAPKYNATNENQVPWRTTDDGTGKQILHVTQSAASSTTTVVPKGAGNMANGQVATSTTAGTLVAARATRRSVTIKNTDATITVYVGIATVTAGNGMPIKAGESINIDTTALIQVIAASGTPTVAYVETYD